jgi:iron(III) transport system ATP-binding protein
MQFLQVANVSKKKANDFVLKNIEFVQERFQQIAIAGETGSGKTTLLKIIGGLVNPDEGAVFFEKERVKRVPEEKLIPGHPGIGFLSQQFELPNNLRVEQVLSYANQLPAGKAEALYEICQVSQFLKRRTDELSGGEKQRIALARLLSGAPRLLLLDEPFSNLDMMHKKTLKSVIHDIGESLKISFILVSHDPMDTLSWADKFFIIKAGQFIQQGTANEVYYKPISEYAGGLLGNYNLLSGDLLRKLVGTTAEIAKNRKAFARPEQLKLSTKPDHGLKGTVVKINFFGGFCELEIRTGSHVLAVRTDRSDIQPDDPVWLSTSPKQLWYL